MKKLFLGLIAGAMIISLCACSNSGKTESKAEDTQSSAAAVTDDSAADASQTDTSEGGESAADASSADSEESELKTIYA